MNAISCTAEYGVFSADNLGQCFPGHDKLNGLRGGSHADTRGHRPLPTTATHRGERRRHLPLDRRDQRVTQPSRAPTVWKSMPNPSSIDRIPFCTTLPDLQLLAQAFA